MLLQEWHPPSRLVPPRLKHKIASLTEPVSSLGPGDLERFRQASLQTVPGAIGNQLLQEAAVAYSVIGTVLGPKWFATNLNPATGAEYFLFQSPDDSVGAYVRQYRILQLGRHLYELQHLPDFDGMVQNLRTRSLVGACAELHAAYLLTQNGHPVRFVLPTGTKGGDFDQFVSYRGSEISIEVKAKGDHTPYTKSSLLASIKSARQQLPSTGPGVVFVHLPSEWTEDARFIGEIDAVVDQVLRNSKRMNALIFFWEQWIPAQPHGMVSMSKFHPYFHSSPRTPVQDLESLLRGFGPV